MVGNHSCLPPTDAHHWKTRGSGGTDALNNLAPLCRVHHVEVHQIGVKTFFRKYEEKIVSFREAHKLPPLRFKC